MGRQLPPFAAVRAFEAAARHLSFRRAAEELCLSPSAVSHQVRALEGFLDTALFERGPEGVRLTLTGATYAGRLTGLLDGIDAATRTAGAARTPETLRVLTTPGFAARWLVPRLSRFAHADAVRLRLSEGAPSVNFAENDADVVVQWASDPVPGAEVVPLMRAKRFPVIAPALRDRARIERPADLLRLSLIQDEVMDMWADWFRAAGVVAPGPVRGPRFPNCELSTTAAEQGSGVSLAYDHMVADTLAAGRLVRLFDAVTAPFVIYSVVVEERRRREPLIAAFTDFLFAEAEAAGTMGAPAIQAAE